LVRLFADDTSLSYSSTNLLQIERKLNSDINILKTWTETWLVKFNPGADSTLPSVPKKRKFENDSDEEDVKPKFLKQN
jgi:hypothetical protein